MRLPKESVEEFQKIYKEEYHKELSYEEAEEMGKELLEFYALISR